MNDQIPSATINLGIGLLSIGRSWGYLSEPPPPEATALLLLEYAIGAGIRFFDTAPAYGTSEKLFGDFLSELGPRRASLTVATKMGEHWDAKSQTAFTDHSYDALHRSLDQSIRLLGRIDILQIHKATVDNVGAPDVLRAIEYARSLGISQFGVSVRDMAAAEAACALGIYSYLQFPYNLLNPSLEPLFEMASKRGMKILINRPFAMGQLIHESRKGREEAIRESLGYIHRQHFTGYILTGTKSPEHLRQTVSIFRSLQG